ncbi:PQQ-binding-like beta-propeller repeat protein [Terriglobus saanensis]|uniref:Pyrrolo-quinoline quinone repeat-containing protein n=1 Tax=Terriglobus saanensis (strain ATCC BAA-1853 / DSM 23119 / SP1PR4) TaxID=401053 RepID=E8UYD6_TERSS|nr:PQQ-binding-like beta-propeller repeat protein [Terriglobus saanensis]ADV82024.1 Pyrrolo-quinoline quinone repeat-containing protein [Terriglobus saanensis SP1PR4]
MAKHSLNGREGTDLAGSRNLGRYDLNKQVEVQRTLRRHETELQQNVHKLELKEEIPPLDRQTFANSYHTSPEDLSNVALEGPDGRSRSKVARAVLSLFAIVGFELGSPWMAAVHGQTSATPEWNTASFNPARDAWQRNETKINPENAKNLQLLWKAKLEVKTMGMQSFREPLIVSSGGKTLTILAGSSNEIYALDADSGAVVWKKKLAWASEKPEEPGEGSSYICTNALSATPVVTPSGAGERFVYVIASDGYLHTLALGSGEEKDAPLQVLPEPHGKPYGLNLVNNVIYTITGRACGGNPNALYAVNLANKKVTVSQPPQAGLWGVAGATIGADGTIYFESGDGVYDAKSGRLSTSVEAFTFSNDTLTLKDYYTPSNYEWLTKRDLDMDATAVIFPYKSQELMVASGKEGRFVLIDTKSMGGVDHMTPVSRTPLITNTSANLQTEGTWGSHASWLDADGTRWVLAPTGSPVAVKFPITNGKAPNGGVIAMKLEDKGGKLALAPVWQSRNMITAEPPVIANGVVYVLAAGEFTGQANETEGGLFNSEQRIQRSVPAKLFLLDARTGKELYSSGDQVASFLHQAGLSVAGGRVIFGTFDGTIYCYGLK